MDFLRRTRKEARGALVAVAVGAMLVAGGGLAAAHPDCPPGLNPAVEYRLFFGLTDATGRTVTKAEWEAFVADEIRPHFRAGFTQVDGFGQWEDDEGTLHREPVKLVIGMIAPTAAYASQAVDEISEEFERRFVDPVFRTVIAVCSGLS